MNEPKHCHGKPCNKCGGTLRYKTNRGCVPCTKAYRHRARQTPEYRAKAREDMRRRYQENPEHFRAIGRRHHLKKKLASHGVDREWYDAQPQECALCRAEHSNRARERLAIDHNPETGMARGLLCGACNRGIGYFKDDPVLLRRAATYVEDG